MDLNHTACDDSRIELSLRQELTPEEQAAFDLHLNDCAECRRRMERVAAGSNVWAEVRRSLNEESKAGFDHEELSDDVATLTAARVASLLAPSDDERMLGRLGTYEIMGVVGAGGMGVVFKALDQALNRHVAVKLLAPHLADSGAARKRFSREARAAAAVVHENVIEIYGVAESNGLPYLVMPYLAGPSLQRRLDDEGPLSVEEILRIGMQAARGLAAAHSQGLVHRDVKPANILLADGTERATLTDFGLARAADDGSLTRSGVIAGTPQYMSPEQARGDTVEPRSDLFSLGSVLYAMCTGHPPFRAESSYGILRRVSDDEPRSIRESNPHVPEWLCRIVGRLMSKQPCDRFSSSAAVAALLEQCLAHVQQPHLVPLPDSIRRPEPADSTPDVAPVSSVSATGRGGHRLIIIGLVIALLGPALWQIVRHSGDQSAGMSPPIDPSAEPLAPALPEATAVDSLPSGFDTTKENIHFPVPAEWCEQQPRLSLFHPGVDVMNAHVRTLARLTSGDDQRCLHDLNAFVDDISLGIGRSRWVSWHGYIHSGRLNWLTWLPYADLKHLLDNLESIGAIVPSSAVSTPGSSDVRYPFAFDHDSSGWLRVHQNDQYVAVTTPETDQAMLDLADLVGPPVPAVPPAEGVVMPLTLLLRNGPADEDDRAARRNTFEELKDHKLASLTQQNDESDSSFTLRRGLVSWWYDEAEMLYADASSAGLQAQLESSSGSLQGSFSVQPVPDSALSLSINQSATAADRFGHVSRVDGSILSLRVNQQLTSLRQKNALDCLRRLEDVINEQNLIATPTHSGESRIRRQLITDIFDAAGDVLTSGHLNLFVEAKHDGTAITLVGALSLPETVEPMQLLEQLERAGVCGRVTDQPSFIGEVECYELRSAGMTGALGEALFGAEENWVVGIDGDCVWLAAGPGATELLAGKVREASHPRTSGVSLALALNPRPWVEAFGDVLTDPESSDDSLQEHDELSRTNAWRTLRDSLSYDDRLSVDVLATDSRVSGSFAASQGLARFIGRRLARMVKTKLEL